METDIPGRRERKRLQTLDHLTDTAFRLFEAHGFEPVTMEQIAAAADVAKGTLYNHFPVKEALLEYRFHRDLAAGAERFQAEILAAPDFRERLRRLLAASADWCAAHRTYLPHYLRHRFTTVGLATGKGRPEESRSGFGRLLEWLVRQGHEAGDLRRDLTADHLALMLQYLYLGTLMRWLSLPDADLHREFDAMIDLFLNGAGAPSDGLPA